MKNKNFNEIFEAACNHFIARREFTETSRNKQTMPSAITFGTSAATSTAYSGGAPSAASLQAQLQRYQKQLSDCVNCASAKTPQGKADIEAISARISQVQQRIAQAENSCGNSPNASQPTAAPPASAGLIDVYA